ncbi:MAG: hypothetical protein ACRDNR_09235 [Gaiellaceae bacterium]
MTAVWYRFESHGNAEVTVFTLDGEQARTGARGTRFFKKHIAPRADAEEVVVEALRRMRDVRKEWPREAWPQPAGLQANEHEIVLPALLLATGWSTAEVARIVQSGHEPD